MNFCRDAKYEFMPRYFCSSYRIVNTLEHKMIAFALFLLISGFIVFITLSRNQYHNHAPHEDVGNPGVHEDVGNPAVHEDVGSPDRIHMLHS